MNGPEPIWTVCSRHFSCLLPKTAKADTVIIGLLDGYFKEQFLVNGSEDSLEFWQVFDRTDNAEVPREQWTFDEAQGTVTVAGIRHITIIR